MMKKIILCTVAVLGFLSLNSADGANGRLENAGAVVGEPANADQQQIIRVEIKAEDWRLKDPSTITPVRFWTEVIHKIRELIGNDMLDRSIEETLNNCCNELKEKLHSCSYDYNIDLGENIELVVHIPSSVTTISKYAFCGCKNLKQVYFDNNGRKYDKVLYVNANAFKDCINLESVFNISSIVAFQRDALSGCTSLKELHFAESSRDEIIEKIRRICFLSRIPTTQVETILQNSLPSETNRSRRQEEGRCEVQ